MDGHGARELSRRIEAQQHWRVAKAVQEGSQPASDPDVDHLEDFGGGARLYRPKQLWVVVLGGQAPVLVSRRLKKTLVDGRWHTSTITYFVADGEPAKGVGSAVHRTERWTGRLTH